MPSGCDPSQPPSDLDTAPKATITSSPLENSDVITSSVNLQNTNENSQINTRTIHKTFAVVYIGTYASQHVAQREKRKPRGLGLFAEDLPQKAISMYPLKSFQCTQARMHPDVPAVSMQKTANPDPRAKTGENRDRAPGNVCRGVHDGVGGSDDGHAVPAVCSLVPHLDNTK